MRRAFTLIEILISASVLGLGVLGIATLFAGAARQQQIAAEQTDAERNARNIEALIGRRFDRFSGLAFDENTDPSFMGLPLFATGQWHPVASVPFSGIANGRQRGSLSLDMTDNGLVDQSAFGVSSLGDVPLFSLNGGLLKNPWGSSIIPSNVNAIWAGATNANRDTEFNAGDLRLISNQNLGFFSNAIPDGRLQPDLSIEVEMWQEVEMFGVPEGLVRVPSLDRRFEFRNPRDIVNLQADPELWPNDPDPVGTINYTQDASRVELVNPDDLTRVPAGGGLEEVDNTSIDGSWITVRVKEPDTNDPPRAYINEMSGSDMQIAVRPSAEGVPGSSRLTIGRIVAKGVETRSDNLLSFEERIEYTPDDAFPGGQRPTGGVALLFKRGVSTDQLMAVSYSLEPLGRVQFNPLANAHPFVPPDSFARLYDTSNNPAQHGLFSQVQLDLAYDPALETYVVRADEEDEWAIQKGQILIIGARNEQRVNPVTAARPSDFEDAGALSPLRILSTRRPMRGQDIGDTGEGLGPGPDPDNNGSDGRLEGVLSAPPYREGFQFMLENLEETQTVWAWAMRDVVTSDLGADQNVEWRVRPTGARVITFGANR